MKFGHVRQRPFAMRQPQFKFRRIERGARKAKSIYVAGGCYIATVAD